MKQVSAWLGHADAAFTLKTYIHLMDSGVGDAEFLDDAVRVNTGSTEGPQMPIPAQSEMAAAFAL